MYVFLLFLIATSACCFCLFYYTADIKTIAQKEFAIVKMNRIKEFQDIQTNEMAFIDSVYNKIQQFDPGVQASYEEDDIKFYLKEIEKTYERNSYDSRYKVFSHTSQFYRMLFDDRKEIWSKKQNISSFRKNLEDCEIGLQKRMEEIRSNRR